MDSAVTVTCDRSAWPIVHLVADGAVTEDGTRQLIAHLEELLQQPTAFAMMLETRNARGLRVPHIRAWATFLEERHALLEARLAGVAFLFPSAMLRGALRVLFTWVNPPFEYAVVDTEAAGVSFLRPMVA
ncbi:MAG: hypothetical protein ACE37F_31485 [Nannocystaceae bacterium]|nr:hypothetical protein [bacterium]